MSQTWNQRGRPERLERRLAFTDYEHTRLFLELAADLSEARDIYPDLSFGRTHVSMTLHGDDGDGGIGAELHRFAADLDAIFDQMAEPDAAAPGDGGADR